MYITDVTNHAEDDFDWDIYFKNRNKDPSGIVLDYKKIMDNARFILQENKFEITFVLTTMMRSLLLNVSMPKPLEILELGAATGFLSRWLLDEYGGQATLADNNQSSYAAYQALKCHEHYQIEYIIDDIFKLKLVPDYNIVCSFGLIEHFKDKREVIGTHAKFTAKDGYVIILVPMDTKLSRVYWEVFPELNMGYRELLSAAELTDIIEAQGLKILNIQKSFGYCYDFIGVIAKV